MSRRVISLLVAAVVVLVGGYAGYTYMFATTTSYANYSAPAFEEGASDDQRILGLQSGLGRCRRGDGAIAGDGPPRCSWAR